MNRDFYIACTYHFFRASFLGLATSLAAYRISPEPWTWLILAFGAIAQGINGVDSYIQVSKGVQK